MRHHRTGYGLVSPAERVDAAHSLAGVEAALRCAAEAEERRQARLMFGRRAVPLALLPTVPARSFGWQLGNYGYLDGPWPLVFDARTPDDRLPWRVVRVTDESVAEEYSSGSKATYNNEGGIEYRCQHHHRFADREVREATIEELVSNGRIG